MLVEDVFHVEDWAGYFIQLNLPLPVNENLSAPLYKIIPFFRTTNYFSSAHKIKRSEHSVGCDTLHVFFINPLVKIWSIGDAGVVNLVLIGEINARMILYNFCELVTSHAVVKTSKNTKHVYKINFATIILRYEADMQSVFLSYTKNDLNSSYTCFLRISAPKKYSIS